MQGSTSRCISPINGEPPVISVAKDHQPCGGRYSRLPSPPRAPVAQTVSIAQAAERLGANRACLSVARKLLKRSYDTLRELGEEALQPA